MKCDLEEQATTVQDIGDSRLERVLWLYNVTIFLSYITTLKDEKIRGLYKLQLKKDLDAGREDAEDPNLV